MAMSRALGKSEIKRQLAFGQIAEPEIKLDLNMFPARANAIHMIHFPEELTDVEIARQRLALDEFIALQF